jgi:hypothetical protein
LIVIGTKQGFGQGLIKGIVSRLSVGIKAGGNYSNFTNTNFETEAIAGFHAGFLVNLRLTNHLSIQEDFLFSSQGAKLKDGSFTNKENLNLSYVSVPIVLKYRTRLGIYMEAGAQTGMLVTDAKNTGFKDFANKLDAGAVGGIGYQLKLGATRSVGIGARYYQGFTDVGKFTSASLKSDFRNNSAQASVFYIF